MSLAARGEPALLEVSARCSPLRGERCGAEELQGVPWPWQMVWPKGKGEPSAWLRSRESLTPPRCQEVALHRVGQRRPRAMDQIRWLL